MAMRRYPETIERLDGTTSRGRQVKYLGTLTPPLSYRYAGCGNAERALYELEDGSRIECYSDAGDCRARPVEARP
jgi:hypothetical protein